MQKLVLKIIKSRLMRISILTVTIFFMHAFIKPADNSKTQSSKSAKKLALINSLNPELASLSDQEKKKIVGDGIRFAQTIIWRPDRTDASVKKLTAIKNSLDARLKDYANNPRKQGEKSQEEILNESHTLAHVLNLIKHHKAGTLDLDSLQKDLGIKQRMHKGQVTKKILTTAKK